MKDGGKDEERWERNKRTRENRLYKLSVIKESVQD